ncbi:response regulator [Psychrobacter sp. I-STPA6b]|uniref:response regulator n=1 Tax=Psychrobacter sp. I-STPA6b TaxID=2585718 RepID=UPI001D0C5630|nr:response regulator transcription factor [Psychrobacter sp. I-STPA6b]
MLHKDVSLLHDKGCILLIDDHELFRAGLRLILQAQLDATIIEVEKISDVMMVKQPVDVILLDICLPGLNGIDGMAILQKRWPQARIMLLSALSHHHEINTALELGASCFVNKNSAPQVICNAVKSLLEQRFVSQQSMLEMKDTEVVTHSKPILSARLLEILALIAEGESNKVIAARLHLSEHTVRNHIVTLMKHFEVSNRTQIILAAQRTGYLEVPSQSFSKFQHDD